VHGVYNTLDFTFYFETFVNVTLNFNIEHVQPHLYILLMRNVTLENGHM
jgi:hypothetical protein